MSAKLQSPSLAALSRSSGIARETLRQWQAQGIDIHDPEALLKRIEAKKGRTTGELGALKEEKLRLECQRLQAIIERENELWLPTAEVLAAMRQVGIMTRLHLREMTGSIIGELEGRTGPQMFKILQRAVHDVLVRLSQMEYGPDSPEAKRLQKKIEKYDAKFKTKQSID